MENKDLGTDQNLKFADDIAIIKNGKYRKRY